MKRNLVLKYNTEWRDGEKGRGEDIDRKRKASTNVTNSSCLFLPYVALTAGHLADMNAFRHI